MGACVVTVNCAAKAPIFQSSTAVSAWLNCGVARSQLQIAQQHPAQLCFTCPLVQVSGANCRCSSARIAKCCLLTSAGSATSEETHHHFVVGLSPRRMSACASASCGFALELSYHAACGSAPALRSAASASRWLVCQWKKYPTILVGANRHAVSMGAPPIMSLPVAILASVYCGLRRDANHARRIS